MFLSSKSLLNVDTNDKLTIKVKGLTKDVLNNLSFDDIESLLTRNHIIEFKQNNGLDQ